jgi:hypothetical protein
MRAARRRRVRELSAVAGTMARRPRRSSAPVSPALHRQRFVALACMSRTRHACHAAFRVPPESPDVRP